MNTIVQQMLKPATETYRATGPRSAGSPTATGIGEILSMRVGCWQAPVHIGFSLPVAS
jgi:hypothetical protein